MCLYLTEYFFVVAGVFRAYFYGKITFKRKKCEAGRPISIRTCIYPLIQGVKWLKGIYMIIKRCFHETPQ